MVVPGAAAWGAEYGVQDDSISHAVVTASETLQTTLWFHGGDRIRVTLVPEAEGAWQHVTTDAIDWRGVPGGEGYHHVSQRLVRAVCPCELPADPPADIHIDAGPEGAWRGHLRATNQEEPEPVRIEPLRVPTIPRAPHGPRGDWSLSFSLEKAFQAATEPGTGTLGQWMDDHPGAYIAEARHAASIRPDGSIARAWMIVASDGVSWRENVVVPAADPLRALMGRYDVVARADVPIELPLPSPPYPPVGVAPSRLPDIGALRAAFVARTPQGMQAEPESWGYTIGCGPQCDEARVHVIMGHDGMGPSASRGLLEYAWHDEKRWISVDGSGSMVLEENGRRTHGVFAAREAPGPLPPSQTVFEAAATIAVVLHLAAALALWRGKDLFANLNRRRIVATIDRRPGIHFRGLQRELGLARGALGHHLEALVAGGVVLEHRSSGFCGYFLDAACFSATDMDALTGAAAGPRPAIASMTSSGMTPARIATELGMHRSSVSYHVRWLQARGLLEPDKIRLVTGGRLGPGRVQGDK